MKIQCGLFTGEITAIPYFYVIYHSSSGRYYAGSKYAQKLGKADWSRFMVPGGYTTSSKHINEIIKAEGLGAFQVTLLVSEDQLSTVFNPLHITEVGAYEDWYLAHHRCTSDPMWFNKSRGGYLHTKKHRAMMQEIIPGLNITFAQLAARRSATVMAKVANGITIREQAAKKTAQERKNKLTYGKYEICGGDGKVMQCIGTLHTMCLDQLMLPKSVFQELRDRGEIKQRSGDAQLALRDLSLASPHIRAMVQCAQARIKYNGWTCKRLASPHGQGAH